MAGVKDMIKQATRSVNKNIMGTPNEITRWYADRNGKLFLNELWCEMSITFWAFHSGNHAAVCFGIDFASTTKHVERFRKAGKFHDGAAGIRPGDIVFFPREGHDIGHVGLVRKVEVAADVIRTIEGNTSDAVRHRTHRISGGSIAGYGRPSYQEPEEDDFMALFKNVGEFKAAVRAVVKDEVKDEVDRIYKALARGEIDGQMVTTSTHFQDSNRGLSRHIHDEVDRIYRALARGEIDGQMVTSSTHFQDSNRHLANLLKEIADRLPQSSPNP
jgi:hypothetical protein